MERFSIPLTIHMDPLQTPDNGSEKILEALKKVAERYAPCRFHDLDRYVKEDRVQISVDLEMPPGSTEKKEAEAAARQAILEIEPDAQVTISLDVDYYEAYRHARQ